MMTADATQLKPNEKGTVKPVVTPEYKKVISPTKNLIRTQVKLGRIHAISNEPKHKALKKFDVSKRSIFKKKPLESVHVADILEPNSNIEGHRGFEGSHLIHFLKAMRNHTLKAKQDEKLRIKPACEGLSRYARIFDCKR